MIILGLTGSIGMGKSTTANLFAERGAAVWNADAAVHALYAPGGEAVAPVEAAFPGVTTTDRGVDREKLSKALAADPAGFARLEAIVHPLGAAGRAADLARAEAEGVALAVLDIPLLFETGGDAMVDAVVVVTAPEAVQRERVLARPGMTAEKLDAILARQTPDAEKRRRADFIVDTGRGLDVARTQVRSIIDRVLTPGWRRGLPPTGEADH